MRFPQIRGPCEIVGILVADGKRGVVFYDNE